MTGRGTGKPDVAGGPPRHDSAQQDAVRQDAPRHVPVLLEEVCAALDPGRGGTFLDGTFGAGGYTRALLEANRQNQVIGIDRDPDALKAGAALVRTSRGRLRLVAGRFGELDRLAEEAGSPRLDGVVLDIGVSSMQIDEAERGFSFRTDGPLDMRMEQDGPSAADILNEAPEAELADIFYHYGEERRSRAIARAVIEARRRGRIETTRQLAELVATLVWAEPGGAHPATRVFQALRIAVNDELGELVRALHAAESCLAPGGRLVVVTFHSLEDRIVKQFLAARTGRMPGRSRHLPDVASEKPTFALVTKGPVAPGDAEIARNPRARSAKLRAAERNDQPVQPPLAAVQALAELPGRTSQGGGR